LIDVGLGVDDQLVLDADVAAGCLRRLRGSLRAWKSMVDPVFKTAD